MKKFHGPYKNPYHPQYIENPILHHPFIKTFPPMKPDEEYNKLKQKIDYNENTMPICKFLLLIANSPNGMRMWSQQEKDAYESAARNLSILMMRLDGYSD